MSDKIEFLEKHCSTSKDGIIALSNSLVETAVKIHNCPIKVTCSNYPGEETILSVVDLLKPEFTAGPYEDQYRNGATYSLYMYKWKGVAIKRPEVERTEKPEEVIGTPIIERKGKGYVIKTPVIVTTFEEKEVTLHYYVGMIIQQTREARGLNQTQLANLTGGKISSSSISQIEAAITNPILSSLEAIADALGLHITDLFPPKY